MRCAPVHLRSLLDVSASSCSHISLAQAQKVAGAVCLSAGCCAQITAASGAPSSSRICMLGGPMGRGKFQIATANQSVVDAIDMVCSVVADRTW